MDVNTDQLTIVLCDKCGAQRADVVVGAAMNVILTTLQQVPDKKLMGAAAATLRHMADQLEQMASGEQHH